MDGVSTVLIALILLASVGFIVFASESMRKKAIADADEMANKRMREAAEHSAKQIQAATEHSAKESEKHLAELREIKELLKKISWHLDRKT